MVNNKCGLKSEQVLLKSISKGCIKSFEYFFQRTYPRLLNYACLFIENRETAEDIVQDAFINMWNKRHEVMPDKSAEALMFKSVRNRCLNYLRNHKTYISHINSAKIENLQFLSHYDFLGEEEEALEELLLKELDNALESLPEKCRQVFVLSKIDGVKQQDIANQLGISIKAVEKHIAIGKKKVREHLIEKFPALGILINLFLDY
ncbi:RNA polymerase sigma-70 factor [Carboxylicivirga sp. RSCT41]|uniref:RNA polymerase sigma-70 factor n=1 Tax=Carboxylicivirga agarovorans TaxID=3417570 RepID=UPI003D33A297